MKRGFPRPRTFVKKTRRNPYANGPSYGRKWDGKNYPHPYSADDDTISVISSGRMKECVMFKRCATCGDPVEEEEVGLILFNTRSRASGSWERGWIHSESGPYHLKCLVLNFTLCPHLADTKIFMPGYGKWTDVRDEILSHHK